MRFFELVLDGFDGSTDSTDDHVLWIAADSELEVRTFLAHAALTSKVQALSELPTSEHDGDIDFNLSTQESSLKRRIESILRRNAPDKSSAETPIHQWVSPPVTCPFCGDQSSLVELTQWSSQSVDDPGNRCDLTEYQCHAACEGRSFWC